MKFIPQFEIDDRVIDLSYGYGRIVTVHNNTVHVKFDEKDIPNVYEYHKNVNQYIAASTGTSLFSCESMEIEQYHSLCEHFPLSSMKFTFDRSYYDVRLNLCGVLMAVDNEQIVVKYDGNSICGAIVRYSRNHYPQVLFDNTCIGGYHIPQLRNYNLHLYKLKSEYVEFNVGDAVCVKGKDTKLCGRVFDINYLTKPVEVTVASAPGVLHKHDADNLRILEFVEPTVSKTNIHEFKPFDKVLVRDDDDEYWHANFFSHYYFEGNDDPATFCYWCIDHTMYIQCIPYEGNEKLVGTMDEPK